jgi:hypothetical protein
MSRAQNYEFQEWWNKHREINNLLETSSETPSSASLNVDIRSPASDPTVEKGRARSARQLSWVCLLRFQQIFGCLTYLTNGVVSLLRTANRRIASPASAADSSSSRLYRLIKAFLITVLLLLCVELAAYFKGWHFRPPSMGAVGFVYANWLEIRANYLAPPLQSLTNVCIVLFLVQSVDRVVLILGCFWIKFRRVKPVAPMEYAAADEENADAEDYPMVLVQIPMCNEREVRTCRFRIPFNISFCEFELKLL